MQQKQTKDYTLLLLAIVFAICALCSCTNEGIKVKYYPLRDYQLEVTQDSIYLFDGDSKVGAIPFGNSPIDSVIMNDNL